jgi:hypothetical protein
MNKYFQEDNENLSKPDYFFQSIYESRLNFIKRHIVKIFAFAIIDLGKFL